MNQVEVKRRQIQLGACILGCFNVWLFGKTIGINGIAYLAVAGEGFLVMWILTGRQTADALGRMLRGRYQKGQYKNASKIKRNIMLHQGIMGLLGTVLFFCLAGLMTEKLFRVPYSKFLMWLLAPAIFIRGISNVLLGYFQGEGSELPSAVTSVLRQLLFLGFGLLFSRLLLEYGKKVSALLGQDDFTAMYGGIGVGIAILVTELLILLFLILSYKGSRHAADKRETEGMKVTDSFLVHVRSLYRNMSGKNLFGLLESLFLWMGCILYQKSSVEETAVISYGRYVGEYLVLGTAIVLAISILLMGIITRVVVSVRKDEYRYAKEIFQSGLRIAMIHALFFVVFVAIMAMQICGIFGVGDETALIAMLRNSSVLIAFAVLAFYFSRLLLLLGKEYFAYICAGGGDIVFIISLVILLNMDGMDIMALVYAGMIGAGVYALISAVMVCRLLRTGVDWLRTLAVPLGSVCLTGLLCFFLGRILTPHLGNLVTVLVCLVLGSMVYWAALLLLRSFREQELDVIPGGRIIRAIGQILHV